MFYRRQKFNAHRTNGMGSKLESAVHDILKLRERSGAISDIRQQVSVDLGFGIKWKVDFSFTENGQTIYAEAKGVETERYRMCLKLWRGGQGPGPLEIWKGDYKRPRLVEVVNVR